MRRIDWSSVIIAASALLLLVVAGLLIARHLRKPTNDTAKLEAEIKHLYAEIDSLQQVGYSLKEREKEIIIKYRYLNEKQIIYILNSDDTLQPGIRTKQRARADSLLGHR